MNSISGTTDFSFRIYSKGPRIQHNFPVGLVSLLEKLLHSEDDRVKTNFAEQDRVRRRVWYLLSASGRFFFSLAQRVVSRAFSVGANVEFKRLLTALRIFDGTFAFGLGVIIIGPVQDLLE